MNTANATANATLNELLTEGAIVQVYYNKDWRIAQYERTIQAHSYQECRHLWPVKTKHVPDCHSFCRITALGAVGDHFTLEVRGAQIRPVTEECRLEIVRMQTEIRRMQAEMKRLEEEAKKLRLELRELCGYAGMYR